MRVHFARLALGWAALGVLFSLAPCVALADARVTTLDGTEWPDAVASLEADTGSQGRVLSLCVRDDATFQCTPCGSYTLAFDEAGLQAFRVEACDRSTGASRVTLVDRSALFDHGHAVPRPRAITVRAAIVRSIETSGGAASTGGSALGCTARIRPYLRDLEHGTDVYLGPDQYDVVVRHAGVDVSAIGNGWMLASETRIDTEVDYDVIERGSGENVMSGHASLECASQTLTTIDDPAILRPRGSYGISGPEWGSIPTMSGRAGGSLYGGDFADPCNGHYGPQAQHVIEIVGPVGGVEIHADAEGADLTLAVRTSDGAWHCNDDGGRAPHALDPIVVLSSPPVGPVEVWVGTYAAGADLAYQLHVVEPGTTADYSGPLTTSVAGTVDYGGALTTPVAQHTRRVWRPDGGLLASGVLVDAFSWAFMAAFDAIPEMLCDHPADCPNATWRSAAWIPFVGPWIAESLDGANGSTFTAPAIADAVLQDIGLFCIVTSLLVGHERELPAVALGEGHDAPRLALGGSPGTSVGATLTF